MLPDLPILVFAAFAVLGAGYVRGFSGFGFSMITIITLSLVLPPAKVVPAILLWEVAASSWLLPKIWKDVDWRSLIWLGAGSAIGNPIGVYLLANLPEKPMRIIIATIILSLVILMWTGFKLRTMPGKGATAVTGAVSGVFNGAATVGGPPIIMFFFSSPAAVATGRASMIAFFLGTDIWATGFCAYHGLLNVQSLALSAVLMIPLIIGVSLGGRSFVKTDEKKFRRAVLTLLFFLSISALIRAIIIQ